MKPVLLLVDVQHDFLKDIVDPHPAVLLLRVEQFLKLFRSRGLPVAHLRMETTLDPDNRMPHWKQQGRSDCLKGSLGAEAPERCRASKGEPVFYKPFFSGFSCGELEAYLEKREVDCLILAGVNTHVCVKQTALDAYALGFSVRLAQEAVGTYDSLSGTLTEAYLAERGLSTISVQDLERELDGSEKVRVPSAEVLPMAIVCGQAVRSCGTMWTHCGPADGSSLWSCAEADCESIDKAVLGAGFIRGFWWSCGAIQRRNVLSRFAALLATNEARLAELLTEDIGKPLSHARGELRASVAMVEAVLKRFESDLHSEDVRWRRLPVGTIALITPFNNPVMIPVGKFAAALAFGNSVVWKPSLPGWRLAIEVSALLQEAGLPEGVLNLICGGIRTSRSLMDHPKVDAVTLSGGMRAGYSAKAICAARHRPLQAELGGNNAAIVWGEVDWTEVSGQVLRGAFGFAGQRCTANRRLIVAEQMFETALSSLGEALEDYPVGDPGDEATDCGPVISGKHLNRIRETCAIARGAGVRSFAKSLDQSRGYYQSPTIMWNAEPESHLVQEETFGPLLVVQRAKSFEHAMALANGVRHGLVQSLFCPEQRLQKQFLQGAQAGILKLNQATHGAQPDVPFGGWKATGLGPPEHGPGDAEFYTRYQAVYGDLK